MKILPLTKYTTPDSNNTTEAENYIPELTEVLIVWRKADRLLHGCKIGTLSEETLGLVLGLDIAHAI